MASFKPPKPYRLSKVETITSFENWKQNQIYNLRLDPNFGPFMAKYTSWKKDSTKNRNRGFEDDTAGDNKKTAAEKMGLLTLMLDQIASWCPYVSRTFIVKQSTSLSNVWQKIREHYGFLSSGAQFLDLSLIKMEADDRPEDLYQRLFMFIEDNLVKAESLKHNDEVLEENEDMSPTVENTITWLWLHLLNPGLPQVVKKHYSSQLRNKTLASMKTEISQSIPAMLDELVSAEESKAFRSTNSFKSNNRNSYKKQFSGQYSDKKEGCTLCKALGQKYDGHYLTRCPNRTPGDKKAMARMTVSNDSEEEDINDQVEDQLDGGAFVDNDRDGRIARRVANVQSPILDVFYSSNVMYITLDTGSTSNLIRESVVKRYSIQMNPATQCASQADGKTKLNTVGEVHFTVKRDGKTFKFDGLVVRDLNDDIIGGMSFMRDNDIGVRPAKSMIVIHGSQMITYNQRGICAPMVRRSQSYVLRADKSKSVILPGEQLVLETPTETEPNTIWALEPRHDGTSQEWFGPMEIKDNDHIINIRNNTDDPIVVGKHSHVCQIRLVTEVSTEPSEQNGVDLIVQNSNSMPNPSSQATNNKTTLFTNTINVNPDGLVSTEIMSEVHEIHRMYDHVFNPSIPKYNGNSGNIMGRINIGSIAPPQRKARTPYYDHDKKVLLQEKFDQLESLGVFAKPEDVNVVAEYMNLSFLVLKPSGGHRLVTAFAEIGEYCKPQPSIMPNVDVTLRTIGQWRYIIKTDLQQAYYQIPLSKDSMRFCGVATPFKGVRIYTRCAMGLPGSETALEEVMNRVVGELIMEGSAAKIADDLFCGGNTPKEALQVWARILELLSRNGLGLSAPKTIIFPKRTTILGWIWECGTLSVSPHKLSALVAVSPPNTVRGVRSFIGAYKHLSRVIKNYSDILHPLEEAAAGRQSQDKMIWSDELLTQFHKVQDSLKECQVIHIAKPSDSIWIETDGAQRGGMLRKAGLAATLYLVRDKIKLLGGFFNAQLRKGQSLWLPCEIEALAIGSAITHFSPIIVQSKTKATVLTDNKPCVEAYQRMRRGLFSNSSRVLTYLSAACRYQVKVTHIAGAKIPYTDYASRESVECPDGSCQICNFVQEFASQVVRQLTVHDVLSGQVTMPFTNRKAWLETQKDCQELRKVHTFLSLGTRPTKKMTKMRNVKTYLQRVVIAKDGLLVVCDSMPFQQEYQRIVVPQSIIQGLLTAYHIRFKHPTGHQLKRTVSRYFYAINLDKAADTISESCDVCNGLKYVPEGLCVQTSVSPPTQIGVSFAFDLIKREKQLIAVLRETVTSYTMTSFANSENQKDLRDTIIVLSASMKCTGAEIRIDPGPGLASLVGDSILKSNGVVLDLGESKNKNKNPVAERAIEELEQEILRIQPQKGSITSVVLALATEATNSRIRRDGLSARELWTKRDQLTGKELSVKDSDVIKNQAESRQRNHISSAKSKAQGKPENIITDLEVGSLVYLISERSKLQSRDKYMIMSISLSNGTCTVRKFTNGQFRTKTYTVSLNDIFHVVNPVSRSPIEESSDSDLSDPVDGESSEDTENGELSSDDQEEESAHSHRGRPQRKRSVPAWHEDYVMGSDLDHI